MDLGSLVNAPSDAFLLGSLDETVSRLDAELAHAQTAVEDLKAREPQPQNRRKAYARVVSLLHRLPVDVWTDIIKFAIWSTSDPKSQRGLLTGTDPLTQQAGFPALSDLLDVSEAGNWLEAKQISILTRVCKDWRRHLHSSADFWCALELHIYANDASLDEFAPKLEAWFGRSRSLPWSLKLVSSKRQLYAPVFASFLQRNCGRWKELRLCMQDLDVLAPLFHLEPTNARACASYPPPASSMDRHASELLLDEEKQDWTHLETLALDGWFTDSAKVYPFSSISPDSTARADPLAVYSPSICLGGSMPSLTSLFLDVPCQEVHTWKWVPWFQLSDLDLKTGDTHEGNVSILSRCSSALQVCTIVFAPSLRLPMGPLLHEVQGIADLTLDDEGPENDGRESDSGSGTEDHAQILYFPKLKEMTLKKIGYLSPLLSRLTLPALQKLLITMSPFNEPEPHFAPSLIEFLDRSGSALTSEGRLPVAHTGNCTAEHAGRKPTIAGPPLTYFMLELENTRFRQLEAPVITTGEYLRIFERTGKLRSLHLKDYSTDAHFLEKINQRGKTICSAVSINDGDGWARAKHDVPVFGPYRNSPANLRDPNPLPKPPKPLAISKYPISDGHTIVPTTIPVGTLLYHGTWKHEVPPGPEWVATDPEHSYLFCSSFKPGDGCWQLTLAVTRPLNLLYFDGSSAAKIEGALDSQDIIIWDKVDPEHTWNESERIKKLCQWGETHKIDGFMRMELDFEIMLCNFTQAAEIASFLNLAPVMVADSSGDRDSQLLLPVHQGIQAGLRHSDFPGETRAKLDLTRLVSFYDINLFPSLIKSRDGQERWDHRVGGLGEDDRGSLLRMLNEVTGTGPHQLGSGVDWSSLLRVILHRYADRLEIIQYMLNKTNSQSLSVEELSSGLQDVHKYTASTLSPHIVNNVRPEILTWTTLAWAAPIFKQCATIHTKVISKSLQHLLTQSERLILGAIEGVSREICRVLVGIWAEGVVLGLDGGSDATKIGTGRDVASDWGSRVSNLILWLDWSVWVRCKPGCGFEESCYLPTWPFLHDREWPLPRPHSNVRRDANSRQHPVEPWMKWDRMWGWLQDFRQDDEDSDYWRRPQPKCIRRVLPLERL